MDLQQRQAVAQRVKAELEARAWTGARLAQEAGLVTNTISAVLNAKTVSTGTLSKIYTALGIERVEETVAREGRPEDVGLVIDALTYWLMGKTDEDRPKAIAMLLNCVIEARAQEIASQTRPSA